MEIALLHYSLYCKIKVLFLLPRKKYDIVYILRNKNNFYMMNNLLYY